MAIGGACFDFEDLSAMCEDYENRIAELEATRDELSKQLEEARAAAQRQKVELETLQGVIERLGQAPQAAPKPNRARSQPVARRQPAAAQARPAPRKKTPPPVPGEPAKRRIMRSARR
jgi:chromosome segregation ATPase